MEGRRSGMNQLICILVAVIVVVLIYILMNLLKTSLQQLIGPPGAPPLGAPRSFLFRIVVHGQCTSFKMQKEEKNGRRVAQHRDSGLGGNSPTVVVSVFVVPACFVWGSGFYNACGAGNRATPAPLLLPIDPVL